MADSPRVHTPWIQHWRRVRYQLLPVLIFVGAAVAAAALWGRSLGTPSVVGEVNAVRVDAISPSDGTLVKVSDKPFELFDTVQGGQLVARLDDRPTLAALETLQAELGSLRKQLTATDAQTRQDQSIRQQDTLAQARRLMVDIENLRLSIVERKALIETDQVALGHLAERYEVIKALFEKGLESRLSLVDVESERDVVKQRIAGHQKTLAEAEAQRKACDERLAKLTEVPMADLAVLLAPIREAIATQESRIRELKVQLDNLVIRSPITGTITSIHNWPGQNIRVGTPILTIAATQGQYIVSYVRQDQRIQPVVGMAVDVNIRSVARQVARGRVEQVGPQVESVPSHQLRDPRVPEWGTPVRIAVPQGLTVRPGELVDVVFNPAPAGLVPELFRTAHRRVGGAEGG